MAGVSRENCREPRAGTGDRLGDDSVLKIEPTRFAGRLEVEHEEKKESSMSPRSLVREAAGDTGWRAVARMSILDALEFKSN